MKRVLAAIDGSDRSLRSLPWVNLLSKGAEVTLLRVVETPDPLALWSDVVSNQKLEAEEQLKTAAASVPDARTSVRQGSAAETILEVADEIDAELIAITTHGGSPIKRQVLGGTAEKLIHASTRPLLVIPAWLEIPPSGDHLHTIYVALDGSENSESILPLAKKIAEQQHAGLVLGHVLTEVQELERALSYLTVTNQSGDAIKSMNDAIADVDKRVRGRINALADEVKKSGLRVSTDFVRGLPPEAILMSAENSDAEVIAMSAHGHGTVGRIFLGSVASRLLRVTSMPVIIARHTALKAGGNGRS